MYTYIGIRKRWPEEQAPEDQAPEEQATEGQDPEEQATEGQDPAQRSILQRLIERIRRLHLSILFFLDIEVGADLNEP